MKRSEINQIIVDAKNFLADHSSICHLGHIGDFQIGKRIKKVYLK